MTKDVKFRAVCALKSGCPKMFYIHCPFHIYIYVKEHYTNHILKIGATIIFCSKNLNLKKNLVLLIPQKYWVWGGSLSHKSLSNTWTLVTSYCNLWLLWECFSVHINIPIMRYRYNNNKLIMSWGSTSLRQLAWS